MTHQFINTELKKIAGSKLDFSQYIGYIYKKEAEKIKKGIEIGTVSVNGKQLTVSIVGTPSTTTYKGDAIANAGEYADYLNEGREAELNHDTVSYIQVEGEIKKRKFQGIYYSLGEMLTHLGQIEEEVLSPEPELISE